MAQKLFLLDAYALIYRAYYAFIKNPRINSKGVNTSAILGFVNTLEEVIRKEQPTHIGIAFDPPGGTFRHEAFEAYKAHRQETPEAIRSAIPLIKEIIEAYHIPILEVRGFEADDVIGTLAGKAESEGFDTYMMTPDKDYAQLVTDHVYIYKPKFGSNNFEIRGVKEVKEKFGIEFPSQVIDILGLMGDSSDNIPGCPGVGEKTATQLIKTYGSIDNLLANTSALKGALKEKIEANREQIEFSRFLATIKIDVPIAFDAEALRYTAKDETALRRLFETLEFKNLADRILTPPPSSSSQRVTKNPPLQPSLFDVFVPQEGNEVEYGSLKAYNEQLSNYYLVDNKEIEAELLQKLATVKKFAIDTETTSVEAMSAELVGFSISFGPHQGYYIPVPQEQAKAEEIVKRYQPFLENKAVMKVGQNIKYDYIVLRKYGVRLQGELFDTMIAHYLLNPDQRHNMDTLAEIYLGYRTIHIEEILGAKGRNQLSMREIAPEQVYRYAAEDADITLQLHEVFAPLLAAEELLVLFREIEMPLVPVLAEMEITGVRVDTNALAGLSERISQRIGEIEEEIYHLAGHRFNIASPRQVGEVLFEELKIDPKAKKTKTGQYATTEEILEKLRQKHPMVEKILDLRGKRKLLGTYINALPQLIHPETGKIHTSFNQTITTTGRLSSSNPNLQNIPIRDDEGREIRRAFVADPGCCLLSADYSQIELRIMAHLSQDPSMISAFKSGEDIHTATAAKIYKVRIEEVTSEMRRKAKTANFGIIYGISVFGLGERLNISRIEAKELIDGYFATYPRVKAYMEESIEEARQKGHATTLIGRKRSLPDIQSHNSVVRGYAERNAINAPIQGSAADIIKVAMVRIATRLEEAGLRARMILQVHDELNFNLPDTEVEQVKKIVVEEMEGAYPLRVPLIVEAGVGENWLEAH